MKPYLTSLVNALVLIGFGLWGYFASANPSGTAFIPVGIGVLLLVLNPFFKKGNKVIAHIAVLLTLVALLGLTMPLKGSIERGDAAGLIRVIVMLTFTLVALITFIKSFIIARRTPA